MIPPYRGAEGAGHEAVPIRRDRPAAARAATVDRQEALLDQAIEETFPASDPISPMLVS
ncbi:hypothetical protein [Phenylobacterium sp.]|uniref:hypothetical protein n=1 Tax=Phenylobacterium sp. TaxID=1871053 RepID=UPI002FE20758